MNLVQVFLSLVHILRSLILGFHSCDDTAMLVYKQWQNVAQVLQNNRIKFPKDVFRYSSVHLHGCCDVTSKSRIEFL